ncbi:PREDICTED: kinesin-like protein KIF23 isoform X2 [Trachymyrmex septentrionalis]|uniref:kinesin-like protein KIF23 isoform X2 n=1 Tax=Trachymyrmex septentrionalis TaxID=34720 RepID=UPI00084EE03C|nr:PREDICTED: kinesin-like protein KIF23 isoform X2 [Trachymyrmex septentrionalis]
MAGLDDSFPKADTTDPQDEQASVELLRLLEMRIQRRDLLQEDVSKKQNHFRNMLVKLEHENTCLRHDNNEQKKIIFTLEGRICKLRNHIDSLLYKLNNACDAMRNVQQELRDRDRQLQQHTLDEQKLIQRCNTMIQAEINRMTKEMQIKLQKQREQLMSCIKKKDGKLKLVRQILTSAREDTCDNVILMPPIASSSRIESTKKATSIVPKKELSLMIPVNLQTSRSSCGQMRQTLCSRAIFNNDTHEKPTEEPNPSLSKEKSSTMTFMDSQISSSRDRIHQIPCHIRTDSDNVQRKTTKETILMTVAESTMLSDLKTKIIDKSNSMTPIDSSSSTIASTNTIITKINFNKKDKIPVVNPRYQRMQNADRWINHRPVRIVPTGTILQPRSQPHKRTIRKLTNPKDFMTRSSRYCLLSQEQDANGELETKL